MNRFWYSVLLYLSSPLLISYLAVRAIKSRDYRSRWSERFGWYKVQPSDVLFHTASMGETQAAIPLIQSIIDSYPEHRVTVTTTSPTGSALVKKAFGDKVQHCYLPMDFACATKRFVKQLAPKLVVILETELWPNLVHYTQKQGAKVLLANARLSASSFSKYQKYPSLTGPMLKALDYIGVQTADEQQRFIQLGIDASKTEVTGSLKFDLQISDAIIEEGHRLRSQWQRDPAPIWVAASIHPGEFDAVLEAHQQVLKQHPNAVLIMVPRHPEQFDVAAKSIATFKMTLARRSQQQQVNSDTQVLLGDTMGEMLKFLACGDQAFIGGSFIEHGGQNPLEAAAMGLAVLMGESRYNFTDICQMLVQVNGLTTVNSSRTLAESLLENINDEEELKKRQQAAKQCVAANRGAVLKHQAIIQARL
ncbi:3-deoxy-D-manno-octulosonic acid transferase [Parashewanella curva]|uniref:3-deoxy-D-manno-octulosonic acid transferase n=1 Tax=Parashewanella curva TaxID=2338552 RepID=A0A3L8Q1S3_9GAMM|nr:lipid IV(A) 3-deoxy-D-manno-octulosonic acid transferase [Parashewanella curva]RLV60798.1 3-deoxy-D-manno-octulosonic acid transferase [Parashewanella curva]